jgi:hypothetical protein
VLPGGPGGVRPEPGDRPAFRSVLVNALRGRCPWLSVRQGGQEPAGTNIADGDAGQGAVCVTACRGSGAPSGAHPGLMCAAESGVHPVCPPGGPRDFPGARAAGKAGVLMAGLAVRESVTVAGRAERARVARAFTVAVLGPGYPCADDAALQGAVRQQRAAQQVG